MVLKRGFWKKIKKNQDLWISITLAVILTTITILLGYINSYSKFSIDSVVIEVFGTLLGLAVTSFGIVMTLLPHLDIKLLKSDTFDDVVNHFIYLILYEVSIIVIGLIIYSSFIEKVSIITSILIIIQLFLSFSSAIMTVYATLYLYSLFKAIKKQRIEKG